MTYKYILRFVFVVTFLGLQSSCNPKKEKLKEALTQEEKKKRLW